MRRKPPADVSPETPALTTSYLIPVRIKLLLQKRRVALRGRQPVARRQAVAESDDLRYTLIRRRAATGGAERVGARRVLKRSAELLPPQAARKA